MRRGSWEAPLPGAYDGDPDSSTHGTYSAPYPWAGFFACVGFLAIDAARSIAIRFVNERHDDGGDAIGSSEHAPTKPTQQQTTVEEAAAVEAVSRWDEELGGTESNATQRMQQQQSLITDDHDHGTETLQAIRLMKEDRFAFVVLFFGIGLHSFLEGMGIGAARTRSDVVVTAAAVLAHKFVAAFAIGVPLARSRAPLSTRTTAALGFGAIGPFGIAVGWVLSAAWGGWQSAILISLAAGSFLWCGAVELPREVSHADNFRNAVLGELCRAAGFLIMALLGVWA